MTQDPVITVQIPATTGYFTTTINGDGTIRNQGIEALVDVDVTDPESASLKWTTGINFTLNRNEVEGIIDGIEVIPLPSFGLASTQSVAAVGQAYGVLLGTAWQRDDAGNVMVNDQGYPIKDPERKIIGDPNPLWTAGWRNDLSYGNLSLSFLFDVRIGGDMFNGTRNVMRFHGTHIDTETRDETVIWDGVNENTGEVNDVEIQLDEDFYNRYGLTYISEEGVETVNWLRLRDLSINYRLPDNVAQRIRASRVTLALTSRNLFLITNYSGIDPETSLSGAANSFGRDYFNSPNTRSIGLRLTANF